MAIIINPVTWKKRISVPTSATKTTDAGSGEKKRMIGNNQYGIKATKNTPTWGSAADALKNQADQAEQQGNTALADALRQVWQFLSERDQYYGTITEQYWALGQMVQDLSKQREDIYQWLNKDILGKLADQLATVTKEYGPEWAARQRINDYFSQYGNYLGRRDQQQRLLNSALASKYWISWSGVAQVAAQQEAANQADVLKLLEAQNQQISNINQLYNAWVSDYLKNYKGIQDDYVKSLADQNFQIGSSLWQNLTNMLLSDQQLQRQLQLNQLYAPKTAQWWAATTSVQQTPANAALQWIPTNTQQVPQQSNPVAQATNLLLNAWLAGYGGKY